MKNLFILMLLGGLLWSCNDKKSVENTTSPTETTTNGQNKDLAMFEFEHNSFDFGQIKDGEVIKHTFKFKNIGNAPLVISNVEVSCGCTTTNYTKDPVAPQEEGEIEVQFNSAGKSGKQSKPVTVYANVEGGQFELTLYGEIKESAVSNMKGPVQQ